VVPTATVEPSVPAAPLFLAPTLATAPGPEVLDNLDGAWELLVGPEDAEAFPPGPKDHPGHEPSAPPNLGRACLPYIVPCLPPEDEYIQVRMLPNRPGPQCIPQLWQVGGLGLQVLG